MSWKVAWKIPTITIPTIPIVNCECQYPFNGLKTILFILFIYRACIQYTANIERIWVDKIITLFKIFIDVLWKISNL